jgi:hypothetical protein
LDGRVFRRENASVPGRSTETEFIGWLSLSVVTHVLSRKSRPDVLQYTQPYVGVNIVSNPQWQCVRPARDLP